MAALGDVGWRPGLSRLYAKGLPYSDKRAGIQRHSCLGWIVIG